MQAGSQSHWWKVSLLLDPTLNIIDGRPLWYSQPSVTVILSLSAQHVQPPSAKVHPPTSMMPLSCPYCSLSCVLPRHPVPVILPLSCPHCSLACVLPRHPVSIILPLPCPRCSLACVLPCHPVPVILLLSCPHCSLACVLLQRAGSSRIASPGFGSSKVRSEASEDGYGSSHSDQTTAHSGCGSSWVTSLD
eukprot:scaffold199683_cov18-Tisochrysis_lutea.AAC.1